MNNLLGVHYHAENTYKTGIELVEDVDLKAFFVVKVAEKSSLINELTDMIIRLNGSPLNERQASQKTAKIWSDVLVF